MAARFTSRRLWFSSVLAVAVLALAVGASQGLARSHANGSATAPIQYHNGSCGEDTGKRFIGTAKFTLKGTTLTVRVEVHGADPGLTSLRLHRRMRPDRQPREVQGGFERSRREVRVSGRHRLRTKLLRRPRQRLSQRLADRQPLAKHISLPRPGGNSR